MKISVKLLAILIGSVFLTTACSREQADDSLQLTSNSMQLVTFSVSEFEQAVKPMGVSRMGTITLAEAEVSYLHYTIYTKSGITYNPVVTGTTLTGGNKIAVTLPEGTYRIVVQAEGKREQDSREATRYYTLGTSSEIIASSYNQTNFFGTMFSSDMFFIAHDFTVTAAPINKQLVLNRIVGRMDVVFTTPISSASKVRIIAKDLPYANYTYLETTSMVARSAAYGAKGYNGAFVDIPVASMKTEKGTSYPMVSVYFFANDASYEKDGITLKPGESPMSLTIQALNASGSVMDNATVSIASKVNIYRNNVTTLRGKLFGEASSWNILVEDEAWIPAGEDIEF